jgi:hypothetical protein
MKDYSGTVQATLDQFVTPVVRPEDEEKAKAQLARMAAFEISRSNPNIGLVAKTSGNNVGGLSVDLMCDRSDGSWVDMASAIDAPGGMRRITVVWLHRPENGNLSWVQPTQALANAPGPMQLRVPVPGPGPDPGPDPGPNPEPDTEFEQEVLASLTALTNAVAALDVKVDGLAAQSDANTNKIQTQIHDLVEDMEDSIKQYMPLIVCRYKADAGSGGSLGSILGSLFSRSRARRAQP